MRSRKLIDTTTFNINNAYYLAQLSKIAYLPTENHMRNALSASGFGYFGSSSDGIADCVNQKEGYFSYLDSNRSTQCFIYADSENVVISFRGTQMGSLADWRADLNTSLVPQPIGGYAHKGFSNALNEVWNDIENVLNHASTFNIPAKLVYGTSESRKIWLTGHSLGGALATLAAAKLAYLGYEIGGLYTFGSPMAGNKDFSEAFERSLPKKKFRLVHESDVISNYPTFGSDFPVVRNIPCIGETAACLSFSFSSCLFTIPSPSYCHVGERIYINSRGEISQNSTFANRSVDQVHKFIPAVKITTIFSDHGMSHYLNPLQNIFNTSSLTPRNQSLRM